MNAWRLGAGTRTRNPATATATAKDGRVPALHLQAHPARPDHWEAP